MSDEDLQILISAWLDGCEAVRDSPEFKSNWWAIEKVMRLCDTPEDCWRFIVLAYNQTIARGLESSLTATPVEDLLVHHGEQYVDKMVELARQDDQFNWLLGGVWKVTDMKDDVFRKIENVRKYDWSWT